MSTNDPREEWRTTLARIGKRNFEIQEMLRLGFVSAEDLLGRGASASEILEDLATLEAKVVELERAQAAIPALSAEDGGPAIKAMLAEIRQERIAASANRRLERAARKQRAAQKREAAWNLRRIERPPHLGRGVSARLDYAGGNADRLRASDLPEMTTVAHMAELMETTPSEIQWLTYHREVATIDHYARFQIPKRSGGFRTISSPKSRLRHAQLWVKNQILDKLTPTDFATGFRPGVSILTNARRHQGSAVVVRVDLKDFFPSITFPRVRGFFESLGYNPGVSSVLGLICTDSVRTSIRYQGTRYFVARARRSLPQGACTSPALANLITAGLDRRLAGWAAQRPERWIYTRYADDLVFSAADAGADVGNLLAMVSNVVVDEGFSVNDKKTAVMRSPHRQMVTGLVINDGEVRVSRRQMRQLRAFLHRCRTEGLAGVSSAIGKDAGEVAAGYVSYVNMINPQQAQRVLAQHPWIHSREVG